jgi:hypothetical protein
MPDSFNDMPLFDHVNYQYSLFGRNVKFGIIIVFGRLVIVNTSPVCSAATLSKQSIILLKLVGLERGF